MRLRPIVRRLARRYRHSGHVEDLEQAAGLGLTKALERFDPAFGADLVLLRGADDGRRGPPLAARPLVGRAPAARGGRDVARGRRRPPSASSATLGHTPTPSNSPSTSTCRWSAWSPPSRRAAGAWRSRSTPRRAPTARSAPSASGWRRGRGAAPRLRPRVARRARRAARPARARGRRDVVHRRPVPARDRPPHGLSQMKVCRVLRRAWSACGRRPGRRGVGRGLGYWRRRRRRRRCAGAPASRRAAGRRRRSTSPPARRRPASAWRSAPGRRRPPRAAAARGRGGCSRRRRSGRSRPRAPTRAAGGRGARASDG